MKKILITVVILSLLVLAGCTQTSSNVEQQVTTTEVTTNVSNDQPVEKNWLPVKLSSEGEPFWTFLDQEGNAIGPSKWQRVESFTAEGLAQVTQNDLVGLIDKMGSVVAQPKYNWIAPFSEGFAIGTKANQQCDVIDTKGKVVFSHDGLYPGYKEGLIGFRTTEGLLGFLDTKGNVVIAPQYVEGEDFKKGKALIKTADQSYGLIDSKGALLKTFGYETMRSVGEDLYAFGITKSDGTMSFGCVTGEDQVILDAEYGEVGDFDQGLAVVGQWREYMPIKGIINKKGEFVVPMSYGALGALGQGYFAGKKESAFDTFQALAYQKSALIDPTGKALTEEMYYNLNLFDEGMFSASDGVSTFLLDKTGSQIPSGFSVKGIGTLYKEGDVIRAEVDNQLAYYSMTGNLIWAEENKHSYSEVTITKAFKRYDRFIMIEYPVLSEVKNTGVAEKINEKLYTLMVEPMATHDGDDEYPTDTQISYTEKLFGHVLEIETTYYDYSLGAAHGNWMTQTTFYDLETGEAYTLPQLFLKDSDYGKVLGAEIRKMIPSNELENYLDLQPIDAISKDRTFRLQESGIEIYFTPYEIAPYAAGQPSFLIPWKAIDTILDKSGDFWKALE